MPQIPPAAGGGAGLVSPASWEAMRQKLEDIEIVPDPSQFKIVKRGGKRYLSLLLPGEDPAAPPGGGGSAACPFGEIVTWAEGVPAVEKTGIAGGIVIAGTTTWNFDRHEINLESDGEWLIFLLAPVEVNRDDDGEILLPGVKQGGTKPAWSATASADYPEGTAPSAASGTGEIVLPVGKLVVTDGKATLTPTGCGGFTITHCAGTLFYTRA